MKILQINAVYGFGSTGRNVSELHEYLINCGVESYVAYGEKKTINNEQIFYIGNEVDHKAHALMSRIVGKQGYFSRRATRILCKKIAKISPDVVHLHNLHSNYINLPILLSFLAKSEIAVAVTLHDCWLFTGKCCHYVGVGCNKFMTECGKCPLLRKNNPSLFFDFSKKMHKDRKRLFSKVKLGVIGVSDWITSEANKSFMKDATLVTRIYNWINTSIFSPSEDSTFCEKYGIKLDDKVILAVSQGWDEKKGIEDLLSLAAALPECKLVMVGAPPKHRELPDNIIIVPYISNTAELVKLYSRADVLVNPSRMETFGKVTAEAMSCGTPVVVYDNTANKELVETGCGAVVNDGDTMALIEATKRIVEEGRSRYSTICIESARRRFEMKENLAKYLEFYKTLVNLSKNKENI